MSSEYCLLQLFVPPTLEDSVIDWLLEYQPNLTFTSTVVFAHAGEEQGLGMLEQVSGRKRQICFSVTLPMSRWPAMSAQLPMVFAAGAVRYQLLPLFAQGDRSETFVHEVPTSTQKDNQSPGKREQSINPNLHRLLELAGLFLRLGATAFGGPAAHIAMMEDEVVRRRQWLTREEFLDLLGATNLIPGPNSTELAIHIGHRRAGWAGLVIAGCCFILPAMLIVGVIAWAYVRFGALPQAEGLLYGVKPVIIAVVAQALWGLSRTAVKNTGLALVGLIGAVLNFFGVNELAVLFGTGLLVASVRAAKVWRSTVFASRPPLLGVMPSSPFLSSSAGVVGIAAASMPLSLWTLFLFFAKVGSVLFGSGYVLLAFLHADLVERWHWLTEAQLMDAIAVGQFTPGPVFTTATFIGYVLAGTTGAIVATVGIFLPAFFFVAISGPIVPRLRKSAIAGAFLDGVNVASLALMAVVTWRLSATTLVDGFTGLLALTSAFLLFRYRINSAWLILAGAALGSLPFMLRA